ncbi:MAG: DNA recombination protein RmuC [Solirubrobacteraceae bacterium]
MLLALTALLAILAALLGVLLARQSRAARENQPPARLEEGETERIVAALQSSLVHAHGEIQRAGIEQLTAQNKAQLEAQSARGEEQLKARQGEIDKGLSEMRQELTRLRELVREVDSKRAESIVKLETVTRESMQQTELLRADTSRLNEVLSGSQTRGQWGERMAEDVLRVAGFVEGIQYRKQQQVPGGSSRPDFTFYVNDQLLHMDVKTPMAGYQRYLIAEADSEREVAIREFKRDIRNRIKEVTTRDYIDPEGGTLDYMLVFIPNEQVYGFIHEHDDQLVEVALRSKVVLCSPLTLFAILAVIRQAAENFKLTQQTNAILQALGGFNNEWGKFKEQMAKLDRAIESSRRAFDDLEGTRTRQLDKQVERVERLRLDAGLANDDVHELAGHDDLLDDLAPADVRLDVGRRAA